MSKQEELFLFTNLDRDSEADEGIDHVLEEFRSPVSADDVKNVAPRFADTASVSTFEPALDTPSDPISMDDAVSVAPHFADASFDVPVSEDSAETAAANNTACTAPTSADNGDTQTVDDMLDAFSSPVSADDVKIVTPSFTGTADALTAAPKAKAPVKEDLAVTEAPEDEVALSTVAETAADSDEVVPQKANGFMRFLGAIVPHMGDQAFDVVRKCIMLAGILVFVGAATYLVDDLILIPIHNNVLAQSLQSQYTPDAEPSLSEEELNYKYPEGIDPAFKKLYYQNNDVRGWITYHSTDGTTFKIDYPIVQSADNDYYLFHDFNRTYNKNGTLFFDYRNNLSSAKAKNYNTIVYGHNMASGQMFAGLNKLLYGVDFARVAPTFTMNTLYKQAEYKVFAVMLVNNTSTEGIPFGYLRTEFNDNIEFATFLSEILARSLYVYGDVDIRPDDEIVTLSTCTDTATAHFPDGRTVVVARKVREGEDPATDVSQISYNTDVLMPYAWYTNQKYEPHPYYTDPNYIIQPLDTLMQYLSTSTAPEGVSTTQFTLYTDANGTYGVLSTNATTMTDINGQPITSPQVTKPYMISISVESTPVNYYVGSGFDYANTKVVALYSDGTKTPIDAKFCAVTGFDSSKPGTCNLTVHYGSLNVSFSVNILEAVTEAPTTPAPETTTVTQPVTTTTVTTTATDNETTTTQADANTPDGETTTTTRPSGIFFPATE